MRKFTLEAKVAVPHIKECAAVRLTKKGDWSTPWGPVAWGEHGDPVITTERRYGKNGRRFTKWVVFVCNDTACKARLHVSTDFVLTAAEKVIRRSSSTTIEPK